ncbi:unnamed protein product [Closterium sp. Naga37s-1]|nr:unnamed protein product [Closterium sp. Naga37s-1]
MNPAPNVSNGDPGSATATAARPAPRRARPTTHPATNRRLEVIDLDTIVLQAPDLNTPINADDDTLAYFDAGEIETDLDEHAEEEGSLPGANDVGAPPTTPGIADQGPTTEGVGSRTPPLATVAAPSPSRTTLPSSPPAPPATSPARPVSTNLAEASPPFSRGAGARAGLSLRGHRVVRWPQPSAAGTKIHGMEGGGTESQEGQLTGADAALCNEIATRTMGGLFRDNFEQFMQLTRELVQSAPDAPDAKRRKGNLPDADDGGSA